MRAPATFATLATLAALALLLGMAGCEGATPGSGDDDAIDRETFIDVQVELELAQERPGTPPATERERILAEHGLSDEELRAFIEVHGSDDDYMQDVWEEVDRRVIEERGAAPADTSG